jgi:hypothetical protein
MAILSRRTVAALAAFCGLLAASSFAAPGGAAGDNSNVVQALRAGGLVIVVRHGATFPDQADTDPLNFDNIAAQRNLNDKGKALAKAFGDAIRQAGVPVGKVFTSKYNRAYQTAVIAGFKDIEKTADITEGGLVVSPNENNRRIDAFRMLLSTAPSLVPTRFSLRTSRTSSMRSARTGSTSKRASPQSSAPRTVATSSSPECRWKNGLTSPRRRSEGRWGL